jgi:hypothetical protein
VEAPFCGSHALRLKYRVLCGLGGLCALTAPLMLRAPSAKLARMKSNTLLPLLVNTEAGINRVAMRSTPMPGTITLTATREGLRSGTITFDSKPVAIRDSLTQEMPPTLSPAAPADGK